jgi:hypothetical protein
MPRWFATRIADHAERDGYNVAATPHWVEAALKV